MISITKRVTLLLPSMMGRVAPLTSLTGKHMPKWCYSKNTDDSTNETNISDSADSNAGDRVPHDTSAGGGFNDFNLRRIKDRVDSQRLQRIEQMRQAIKEQSEKSNNNQQSTRSNGDNNESDGNTDETAKSATDTSNVNSNDSNTSSSTGNSSNTRTSKRRKRILITGANGNLGAKLLQFWRNTHELILVDCAKPSDLVNYCLMTSKLSHSYVQIDLLHPRDIESLTNMIRNADYVVHLAAQNPFPDANWDDCVASIDMTNRVLLAAYDVHKQGIDYAFEKALGLLKKEASSSSSRSSSRSSTQNQPCNLKRIIYASSNHIMGGYRSEGSTESEAIENGFSETALLEPSKVAMFPGTSFMLDDGFIFDSTPYAIAKVSGERLCLQSSMNSHNHLRSLKRQIYYGDNKNENNDSKNDSQLQNMKSLEHIVVRIGWCQPGENLPNTLNATGTPKDESLHKNDENEEDVGGNFDDRASVEQWFRNMWLSNIDLFRLFETCVRCDLDESLHGYTIVNGVSSNSDSRWNVDDNTIGFNPIYDVNNFDAAKMPHEHQEQNKMKTNQTFSKAN